MKKILLIEDNNDVRENTAEILQLSGYEVLTAENGKLGVEKAAANKPDLIICDIMMPVLDGYGVLHMLSRNNETANIPFVFLTAKAERVDFRKGMEMGADDYITKPFDDIELLNAVERRLKKVEIMRQEFSRDIEGLNNFMDSAGNVSGLQSLADNRNVRTYKKRETIYSEGNYPNAVYFLVKGKVKVARSNEGAKELITGLHKDGDFFGYAALLEEGPYKESATAMEDAEICTIPKEDFFNLLYKNAEVSRSFIKMLSDDLGEKEEQLVKLAYNSVRKRVAEALVMVADRFKKDGEDNFTMSISREDLANLAGTATETTIRTLSDFKEEGLVEVKGGAITVLQYQKLVSMRN
jgi:CRP-like cAMP-binding protein/CheY-like chemotaxis protein